MTMAKTIWKYEIPVREKFTIELPKSARVLAVQNQMDVPCMWILLNPAEEKKTCNFRLVGTGHDVPVNAEDFYLGTFQVAGGEFVFHVFQEAP